MAKADNLIIVLALTLLAAPALGADAAEKCQSGKLKIAGKYDFCRLNAQAKAAKTGSPPDYTKCDDSFAEKWGSAETKGAGMCPSNGDEAAIQAFITQHTDDLATALAGGSLPGCPGDLATCSGDLSTCDASLTSTVASLTTCTADLGACAPSLAMVSAGTATAAGVRAGQTFSSAAGIGLSGTMPENGAVTITPGADPQAIAAGYHDGAGTVAGDADLVAGNIRAGVDVFGVTGTLPVGVLKTGQTTSYSNNFPPGKSDGELQKGVARSYTLSSPRFSSQPNGYFFQTVTDNVTGLMWELKTDDGGIHDKDNQYRWTDDDAPSTTMTGTVATQFLWQLNSGAGFAGYTDWRLPNVQELYSLIRLEFLDYSHVAAEFVFDRSCQSNLDYCGHEESGGFSARLCSCTQVSEYWTSTTALGGQNVNCLTPATATSCAYTVHFGNGEIRAQSKDAPRYVRAVRNIN